MFLKSLNFRIASLFAGIFIVASTILFGAFFLIESQTIRLEDRRALQAKILEFWAIYQVGGVDAVQRQLDLDYFLVDNNQNMIRSNEQHYLERNV